MHMKLSSGVKVTIQENGTSKLLLFDRPVKVMELSQEESTQLGSCLLGGSLIEVSEKRGKLSNASRRVLPPAKMNEER